MQQQDITTVDHLAQPVVQFFNDTYPKIQNFKDNKINNQLCTDLHIQCSTLDFNTGKPGRGEKFVQLLERQKMDSNSQKYWPRRQPKVIEDSDSKEFYKAKAFWHKLMTYIYENSYDDDAKGSLFQDFFLDKWEERT